MEIERKFLVTHPPPGVGGASGTPVDQGYLAVGDDEVRVRRKGDSFFLTVKRGAGLERSEEEVELAREQFERLWPLTEGRRVSKRRTELALGDLTVEVDVYAGELDGLVTAEIEFPDVESAHAFEPPDWLGRELTGDAAYRNQALAVDGLPRPDQTSPR